MKKMVRNRIIAAAALSSLLCGVALASSAVTTKKIEANYMICTQNSGHIKN